MCSGLYQAKYDKNVQDRVAGSNSTRVERKIFKLKQTIRYLNQKEAGAFFFKLHTPLRAFRILITKLKYNKIIRIFVLTVYFKVKYTRVPTICTHEI